MPDTVQNEVFVASCTLSELFSGAPVSAGDGRAPVQGRLCLPEYQRPYVWGTGQVQRLVTDLHRHFTKRPATDTGPGYYYAGSIVLHSARGDDGVRLNIIDGQQRLTTLGLLAWCREEGSEPGLIYSSPLSQRHIRANLEWLLNTWEHKTDWFDARRVNITLVITESEDEAYRFFESMNTGGVRLGGPDIIKAYHLRAMEAGHQGEYARRWERFGDPALAADAVLKARYWQALQFRSLPSFRQPRETRDAIVSELARRTGDGAADIAYHQISQLRSASRILQNVPAAGYAIRQPLNAGVNTIHYLEYFDSLRSRLPDGTAQPDTDAFSKFYKEVICRVEGCGFLKKLYDSCLLTYISHFGDTALYEAALWIFRAAYSPRVSNKKTVKEESVPAFVSGYRIFDQILASYTHEECIARLRSFTYTVSPENLGAADNSVKKRFVMAVAAWFGMPCEPASLADTYDTALRAAIVNKLGSKQG